MALSWPWIEHGFAAFGAAAYLAVCHRFARLAIEDELSGPVHRLSAPLKQIVAYWLGLWWPAWALVVVFEIVWEGLKE